MNEMVQVDSGSQVSSAVSKPQLPALLRPLVDRHRSPLDGWRNGRSKIDGVYFEPNWLAPAEIDAARAVLPSFEAACKPAANDEIIYLLTRLAAHYSSQHADRSASQWQVVFADYADDLSHLPADIMRDAIATWRRTEKWWPKVSELIAIAMPRLTERLWERDRLRKMLGIEHTPDAASDLVREVARAKRLVAA